MIWILIIPLIIFWAFLQKHGTGQSRGSLRRQRREARKLGIDPEILLINHRGRPPEDGPEWTKNPLWWLLCIGLWALLLGEPIFEWIRSHF